MSEMPDWCQAKIAGLKRQNEQAEADREELLARAEDFAAKAAYYKRMADYAQSVIVTNNQEIEFTTEWSAKQEKQAA